MRSRAFTLIELMVVVSIIMILMSALLVGVSMLRKSQKRTETTLLIDNLATGISLYLSRYGSLGSANDGSDFTGDPVAHLYNRPVANGHTPYAEFKTASVRADDGSMVPELRLGKRIYDSFGNELRWRVENQPIGSGSLKRATQIAIGSTMGDSGEPKTWYTLDFENGRWTWR